MIKIITGTLVLKSKRQREQSVTRSPGKTNQKKKNISNFMSNSNPLTRRRINWSKGASGNSGFSTGVKRIILRLFLSLELYLSAFY